MNKPCVPVVTPGELAEAGEGSSPVFEVPRGLPRTPLRSCSAEFVCWSCYCVSLHLDLPSQGSEILLILVLNVRRGLAAFCDASCFRRTARNSCGGCVVPRKRGPSMSGQSGRSEATRGVQRRPSFQKPHLIISKKLLRKDTCFQ